MKDFVEEYYIEPEKMTVSSAQSERRREWLMMNLDEYGPEEENTVKLEHKITPQTQGRTVSLLSRGNACYVFRIIIKTKVLL